MSKIVFNPMETAPKDRPILLKIKGVAIQGQWNEPIVYGYDGEEPREGSWSVVHLPSHGCDCCFTDNPPPTGWAEL